MQLKIQSFANWVAIGSMALAVAACQQSVNKAAESTTATTAASSAPTPDAVSPAAASGTQAAADGPIPAVYRGEWAHSAMSCNFHGRVGEFSITATTVQDLFNDLYTVTSVEPHGSGIRVQGSRPSPSGQIDHTMIFTPTATGLTFTDGNNIDTAEIRCTAPNG